MHEFSIIDYYFKTRAAQKNDVVLGIGDDSALLSPPSNRILAVTTDTLVSGTHFFPDVPPKALGYKSLAVNLSDLAAMGAEPAWVTLSLTLPNAVHHDWLTQFCDGFFELADQYSVSLVGGDLVRGPLSVTVQATGFVPRAEAIQRNGAQQDDLIFVSGTLGDAGAGVGILKAELSTSSSNREFLLSRLYYPAPRVELGIALRKVANSAIDISDGLAADLQHILEQSHLGATIIVDNIPLSSALKAVVVETEAGKMALSAGDDYELCFTVPETKYPQYEKMLKKFSCTCIGRIERELGLRIQDKQGVAFDLPEKGYQHF